MNLVSSVWRAGSGTQWVKIGLSWADFKTQDLAYFNKGLRLVDFERDGKFNHYFISSDNVRLLLSQLFPSSNRTLQTIAFGEFEVLFRTK